MRRRVLRRVLSAVGVAIVVGVVAAVLLGANAFSGFQRRASDSLLPSAETDDGIAVVGIDAESLAALGEHPWPRSVQAQIAQRLADAGAGVAVWDVVFADAAEGDDRLAAALEQIPSVVLAEAVSTEPDPADDSLLTVTSAEVPGPPLTDGENVVIAQARVLPDPTDGVVRLLPVVVEQDGSLVPTLSLVAFEAVRGGSGPPTVRPDGVQVGDRFVPTEGRHYLRLNFAEGLDTTDNVISAIDLVEGRVDPDRLRDKVVFIGATEPTLGDHRLVPVAKSGGIPGVLVHANALNTMLTASYLEPVSDTPTVIWVVILALLVALAVLTLPVWLSALATLVVAAAYFVFALVRFDRGDVQDLVYPFIAIVTAFVAALAIRYFTETRQRRRVSSLFAQYVPEEVARELEESGSLDTHLEGQRLDVSLFFCDLRGFTSLSATLEPAQVRAMLNQFYELVTDAILARGGTVLKFVGDEVFAVFGAPLPVEHHPQAALECAMDIQRRAPELGRDLAALGIPEIRFGIGMNSGDVVAAHVGGGRRRQYDVVGDTVNLASRLCGQAGPGEIVLTEAMIGRLDDPPPMESMGAVALKGLDQPVPLFRVTAVAVEAPVPAPGR